VTKSSEFRRHAILLFADLCDFTSLSEVTDPEEVALLLQGLRREVDAIVEDKGGAVNEWLGDGVLCTFGLPYSREDDVQRAIEACLAMHAAVRRLGQQAQVPAGFELRLHSGLHAGLVFASERQAAKGYDLVGDAVNTAARLCAHASRDELWVSQSTIEGVRELFETDRPQPLQLKGKKAPLLACHVVRRSEVLDRFGASRHRGLTPLIGREHALAILKEELATASAGSFRVINIVGSPGIGKTRLLAEFKERSLRERRFAVGGCSNLPNTKPLQPFRDLLWQLLGLQQDAAKARVVEAFSTCLRELTPELEAHEAALYHLLGFDALAQLPNNPEFVQQSLVLALNALFGAWCRSGPLVLIIDDWQWADDASRHALGNLMRFNAATPLLLIIASRDRVDPLLARQPHLELQPFTGEEAAKAIAELLPRPLDLGVRQALFQRSGGNPLFLEELCRANATAVSDEELVEGRVPTTLRGIIQARVERLPEDLAHVLRAAAVIGNEVPAWLLARVADCTTQDPRLDGLVRADLLFVVQPECSFRFKHSTTREVVYETVRLPERRRFHEIAAIALEAHAKSADLPEPHEALAYHAAGAGDHERAARFAELAGDTAIASSSLDRARHHYRLALEALEKLGLDETRERQFITLVEKWASGSLYNPSPEHIGLLERAHGQAMRARDGIATARAEYWLGWFYYALGEQARAISYARSALERARAADDQRLVGQLLLNLGQCLVAACEYDEAIEHLDAGLAIKREVGAQQSKRPAGERRTPLGKAYALASKGLLHGDRGEFELGYACFAAGLGALEKNGHAVEGSCLGMLGMVQVLQGQWAQALETANRAQATAERVNGPYVFAMSRTVSGYARWMLERSESALEELKHAVTWLEDRKIGLYISFNYGYLAEALASAGRATEAREYAERAVARAHTDPLGEASAYRTLARLARSHADEAGKGVAHYLNEAKRSSLARRSRRDLALTELERAKLLPTEPAWQHGPAALRDVFREMGMRFHEREAVTLVG
jgi:class 3 adenylate cyclase/tetratricopeptide (TPR) repeat protein